jgi:hypothetical protein
MAQGERARRPRSPRRRAVIPPLMPSAPPTCRATWMMREMGPEPTAPMPSAMVSAERNQATSW